MTFFKPSLWMLGILLVVPLANLLAQCGMKPKECCMQSNLNYTRMYKTETVETIRGEVITINKLKCSKCTSHCIHLKLKTDKDTIAVHMGPDWYIKRENFNIEPKDKIEAKGSLVTFGGIPAVIVTEIKKGDSILKLRDDNGVPLWSDCKRK